MSSMSLPRILLLSAALSALAACGSDGDGSGTGQISLGVTDSPVDVADAVVVQFTGVELKPKDGPAFSRDFAVPKTIDLLAFQGEERAMLLDGEEVPAGEYLWMRLKVNADPDVAGDSYITIDGADCELLIPSGDERGLQMIRGFTVGVGTITNFTVDFDLRKSVLQPPGQTTVVPVCDGQAYLLKPVVRVVDNLEVGTITGTVDSTFITEQCGTGETQSGVYPGNVYLFGPVADGDTVTPDDYDTVDADPNGADALASAMVSETDFSYTFGFVPAGNYVTAYTCDADDVLIDANDADSPAGADEVVEFTPAAGTPVTVTASQTSTVDFPPPAP
ncbi:MAG TPA: DUF4382 domain-containing protein [Steroidobacteraceae bacterium]